MANGIIDIMCVTWIGNVLKIFRPSSTQCKCGLVGELLYNQLKEDKFVVKIVCYNVTNCLTTYLAVTPTSDAWRGILLLNSPLHGIFGALFVSLFIVPV